MILFVKKWNDWFVSADGLYFIMMVLQESTDNTGYVISKADGEKLNTLLIIEIFCFRFPSQRSFQ